MIPLSAWVLSIIVGPQPLLAPYPSDATQYSACESLPDYSEPCPMCKHNDKKIVPHDDAWYATWSEEYPCAGLIEVQCQRCRYRWLTWNAPEAIP